jgi:hypothetical protein
MRTMLATLGEADVPDERLVVKLAEVFEHYRKAVAAIAAAREPCRTGPCGQRRRRR